ncbi:MAG: hypothetical protein P4L35_18490 [Ignavibacteriaceae bacterium]|nr:hypothetical protein [Ignavibacteriaceae bacterium]
MPSHVQSSEFIKYNLNVLLRPYDKTPDLIAGPNEGTKMDFYIDVHSPSDSLLTRVNSPLKGLADEMEDMVRKLSRLPLGTKASICITNHKDSYFPAITNPFEKKVNKYGALRKSHMFGLVTVFDGRNADNFKLGAVMAAYADYIFSQIHTIVRYHKVVNRMISDLHANFHEEKDRLISVGVPFDNYLSFYLLIGFGELGKKGLLLINKQVFNIEEYSNHPVIQWLMKITKTKDIKLPI